MKQLEVKIIENKEIARGFYRMRLVSAYLAKNSKPGQFVEVRCSKADEVLLRRPLGVHRIYGGCIEILYEVIGKGTKSLSARKKGDILDVIGPIGRGFELSRSKKPALIIAGGMGVAPLLCLAENISKGKIRPYVMIGAKT
jgi:dihydroorotate dehydrogenase electron transfer subunit